MTPEPCTECGFEPAPWTEQDVERTLAHVDDLLELATDGLDPDRWGVCVDGQGRSVADHVELVRRELGGDPPDERWPLASAHLLFHHLTDIARLRSCLDAPTPMNGTVAGLFTSNGGVPKLPVGAVMVDISGIAGDVQGTRRHHGRPWQALCLYSTEVVDALRREGHPIAPGNTGENIAVSGVDWSRLRAGLVVTAGEVVCRLSAPAAPCSKNNRWFADGSSSRIDHDRFPGWSRWYASVLAGGAIRPGDSVVVEARP